MSKRTIIILLLAVALICIGYAVYRSTGETITIVEGGRHTIYGNPQHGLIFGLCFIAGLCIVSIIPLILTRDPWNKEDARDLSKRVP